MQIEPKKLPRSPIRTIYSSGYAETKPEEEKKELEIYRTAAGILPQLPRINIPEFNATSMDRLARIVFACAFVIFNLFYWTYFAILKL